MHGPRLLFSLAAWSEKPYLESPTGYQVLLTVVGKIPYLTVPRDGLVEPVVTKACPAWAAPGEAGWAPGLVTCRVHVDFGVHRFLSEVADAG
eukprot:10292049-Prorocentrum_lima.AAC.1